jgi:two-component system, response regulator YesN
MARPQVLLVEDDRRMREIFTLFLSEAYEVKQAATGAEALGIIRNELIAAVVLDYRLPDRSGLEVLTEIRAARPRLPVVMITGYGSELLCASALKLGVRDYFSKPVILEDVRDSVRRLLSEASPLGQEAGARSEEDEAPPVPVEGTSPECDLSIQHAIKLIELRYWDDLSLGELAREVGISKFHLSRRFKEETGVTFRGYLLRVRLERAKALLSRKHASITEVAYSVGFGDLPRFDKLFKRYTGLTPSTYRARHVGHGNQ